MSNAEGWRRWRDAQSGLHRKPNPQCSWLEMLYLDLVEPPRQVSIPCGGSRRALKERLAAAGAEDQLDRLLHASA